jgi:hypothetical protein
LFVRYIVIIQAMQSFMDDQLGRLLANRSKTIDKKDFLPIVQKKRLDNQCSVDILKFLVMSLFWNAIFKSFITVSFKKFHLYYLVSNIYF